MDQGLEIENETNKCFWHFIINVKQERKRRQIEYVGANIIIMEITQREPE